MVRSVRDRWARRERMSEMGTARRVALLGWLALAPAAAAHGPCRCLTPSSGPPGTRVSAEYPLYKVVFNPDRADLGIGPEGLWDRHRPGVPVTVLRRTWHYAALQYGNGTFTIPRRARPGRYLIALYDGGEGGSHYSWASFRVTGGEAVAAARSAPAHVGERGISPAGVVGVAGVALAAGFGLGRRSGPSRSARRRWPPAGSA
jgi:hypothetical protein